MKKKLINLNRRAFIRGSAATIIGLPLMEFMMNTNGDAYADGKAFPQRFLFYFCPTALVTNNNGNLENEQLTPSKFGADFEVTPTLSPLKDAGLWDYLTVISGLYASAEEAPGAYNSDYHGAGNNATISGQRAGFSGNIYTSQGPSADTILANSIGDQTAIDRLLYQIDGDQSSDSISFGPGKSSSGYERNTFQSSPAQAYRNLFSNFTPQEVDPNADLERRLRVSSLSFAKDQISRLNKKLGAADKQRLEKHLTEVRALENKIKDVVVITEPSCKDPMFGDDPENISGNIPDQFARGQLFMELGAMAFACDMTRTMVITATNTLTGDGMRHELWSNRGGLHGQVQHGGGQQEDLNKAIKWMVKDWSTLLKRLKDTPEGPGNILDNTAAVFHMEGGKGGRGGDGGGSANHTCDNMTSLLVGRAGGMKPGRHIEKKDTHPAVVINTALKAVGSKETLGEISGKLDVF